MEERLAKLDVWTERLATPWLFWPACLVGVALIGLAVLGSEAGRNVEVKRQCAVMEAERDALAQTRDQDLAIEKALNDDPATIERIVRHELGMVRPGEVRLPQRVRPAISKDSPEAAEANVPAAMRMLAWFGDPMLRFSTMVAGGTLLVCAILFSLPGRQPKVEPVKA
jgi:hypothetical protein